MVATGKVMITLAGFVKCKFQTYGKDGQWQILRLSHGLVMMLTSCITSVMRKPIGTSTSFRVPA
jgi:hypothetical protein